VVLVRLEDAGAVVSAAVVVEEDVLDTDREVVAEPLLEIACLVLDDGHDREAQVLAIDQGQPPGYVGGRVAARACRALRPVTA
jgi:hypothetical protein